MKHVSCAHLIFDGRDAAAHPAHIFDDATAGFSRNPQCLLRQEGSACSPFHEGLPWSQLRRHRVMAASRYIPHHQLSAFDVPCVLAIDCRTNAGFAERPPYGAPPRRGATWPWQQQSPPVVEELASPAGRAVYSSTASKPSRAPRGVADTRHARSWRSPPGLAGWPPVGQPVPAWGPPS